MQFYFRDNFDELLYLYYVVTDKELQYITNSQYRSFPVRFFNKQVFCPLLGFEYSVKIASEKGNFPRGSTKSAHILRFLLPKEIIKKYARGSTDNDKAYIIVPHKELQSFNNKIVGYIERIAQIEIV